MEPTPIVTAGHLIYLMLAGMAVFVLLASVLLLWRIALVKEKRHVLELASGFNGIILMVLYRNTPLVHGNVWDTGPDLVWVIGMVISYALCAHGLLIFLGRLWRR